MPREKDIRWFEENRTRLAAQHPGRWLVCFQGRLEKALDSEEEAVRFAIENFWIDAASVFHAVEKEPFAYIG